MGTVLQGVSKSVSVWVRHYLVGVPAARPGAFWRLLPAGTSLRQSGDLWETMAVRSS